MLVKCETKSNRVKSLSFHHTLSWILASLHNGVIQLWDYRIGSLLEKYEEHEGPVRGIDFHSSQSLFVSGGDDYKIKIWNYRQKKCIFTLLGHLDYIRTVEFHTSYPWILSSSDDQTVRIWNWQSRNCIAVLTGHNHYVMCARFSMANDLVISASLDQTVRVWDITGLRDKTVSIKTSGNFQTGPNFGLSHGANASGHTTDILGVTDAICKYVLEGHERGVNWVTCHPTLPLIASAADDRLIKLWRYNDSKAWEVDTFRGHFNNVSCVIFHPLKELILSNSEDRTIRVWDSSKRVGLHTFRRESDRFWMITARKDSNLIAVGHDAGMVVFKLDRERPAAQCWENSLVFVKDKNIYIKQLDTDKTTNLTNTRRPASAMVSGLKNLQVNNYNSTDLNILTFHDVDEGSYDLITCSLRNDGEPNLSTLTTKTGTATSVAFLTRNRFALLNKTGGLAVYNMNNELTKCVDLPHPTDRIFSAGNNKLLLKSEERIYLFDVSARKAIGEILCSGGARHIVFSPCGRFIAFLSKHNILITNNKLDYLCSFHENIRVKGGAWNQSGIFIYATLSRIKYCIFNGDSGIVHSLLEPIYIMKVEKNKLYFMDRKNNIVCEPLDCTECMFKLALHYKQYDQVALHIRDGRLCGNSVVGFLKKRGLSEIAMEFISDPLTRVNLALDYGNVEEALKSTQLLNDNDIWMRLGATAIGQGNLRVAEMAYQKVKNFEKLSFLYLITGNLTKLRKMLKISQLRNDPMSRFQNALFLGDMEEAVKTLAEVGQNALAAWTAKTYNLTELYATLEPNLDNKNIDILPPAESLPLPLIPTFRPDGALLPVFEERGHPYSANWPLVTSKICNRFDSAMKATEGISPEAAHERLAATDQKDVKPRKTSSAFEDNTEIDLTASGGWGDFNDVIADASCNGWGDNLGAADIIDTTNVPEENLTTGIISKGKRYQTRLLSLNGLVVDYVIAGQFEEALSILSKRIKLVNAKPFEPIFERVFTGAWVSLPTMPEAASIMMPLINVKECSLESSTLRASYPLNQVTLSDLVAGAYRLVTAGKFDEALQAFRHLLYNIPLVVVEDSNEESRVLDLITTVQQYILAMRLESARVALGEEDPTRRLELCFLLACCRTQPSHSFLILRRAMTISWGLENFITTAHFAKRLIQTNVSGIKGSQEELVKAKKVLAVCEQRGTDKYRLSFDPAEHEDLKICVVSLAALNPGDLTVRCPFCNSIAKNIYQKKLCPNCEVSELGARVLGLQLRQTE